MEQTEGDADMAREVAQSMLDDKVTELEEAQKRQPKEGKSVAEKIAARKEHKANIERLEKEIARWQQIIQSGEEREEIQVKEGATATQQKQENTNAFSGKYKLTTERADNGDAFIQNEDGSTALIQIPKEIFDRIGINTMPFKMTASMALHVFNHHKKEGNKVMAERDAKAAYDTAVVVTKNNESNTIGVASGATHPSRIVQEARQPYEDTQDFAQLDSKIRKKSEYAEGLSQLSSEIEQKNLAHMSFCTV